MNNTERRLESRFLCADLVHLTRIGNNSVETLEAVLEDISPLGACVQVDEEVPLGSEVLLTAAGKSLSGVVSYCVYRDYGYFVGIHFLDDAPWSRGVFVPDHLISLETLIKRCAEQKPS
ncbi:MAG TPA: PilZ domain-containing protein [Bryobacteraceae bacterium]|nr:PilZ domain-containing protein [Bryobacteraceae bacterium]